MKGFRSWLTKNMKPGLVALLVLTVVVIFAWKGSDGLQTWIGGTNYEENEDLNDFAALLDSIDIDDTDTDAELPAADKEAMIQCLQGKEVALYVGQSCGFSCEDVQKYGKDMKNFSCVDCDREATACTDLGIEALPTWYANGTKAKDITSLEALAGAFDC